MNRPSFWIMCGVLLAAAPPVSAQSAGHEPAVFELPPNARAAGMGHAFQLGTPSSDVVFYNPALVGRATGFLFGFQRYEETSGSLSLSTATTFMGGGVGIGVQALEYGSRGPGEREGGIDPLIEGGDTGTSEIGATVAYARVVGPVRVGVAGKVFTQRFGAHRDQRSSWDVGVATNLGRIWVGLVGRNLGPDYVIDGEEVSQPEELTLGAGGYGWQVGELDLGLAGAVTRRADGEWMGGGGVEVGYYPVNGRTFVARIGARNVPEGDASPITFGGSYWGDFLVLEYAFQPVDGSDGIHRLSVGWR